MRSSLALLLVLIMLGLSGCGPKQNLEQAIQCDQFKRLPDGSWSTAKDVSLNYLRNGVETQTNLSEGLTITARISADAALIAAALDKKCAAKP